MYLVAEQPGKQRGLCTHVIGPSPAGPALRSHKGWLQLVTLWIIATKILRTFFADLLPVTKLSAIAKLLSPGGAKPQDNFDDLAME
jgi:hypothetical protein